MAVRRFTIELDDSPDTAKSTSPPLSLVGKEKTLPSDREKTTTPEQQEDYQLRETVQQQDPVGKTETIGRTPADLVFAFINRPEFMATTLTCLSFLIFVRNLENLTDFWQPIITAFIFNGVWFGIAAIRRIADWLKKK